MSGLGGLFSGSSPNSGGLGQVRDTADLGTGTTRPSLRDISVGILAGGLRGKFGVDDLAVTTSPERQALVRNLSRTFSGLGNELATLRARLSPGFSAFRKAGLDRLAINRERAIGNLKENLARRRIAGSSFAQDTESRLEAEFAQNEAEFAAESTLQEIQAGFAASQEVTNARAQAIQTRLNELNLQADVALALQGKAAEALSAASLQQQQNAAETAGFAAGAATRACWVARAVYGQENPAWLEFRDRMFAKAPEWFIVFYLKFGPVMARIVERIPLLKGILRPLMDRAWR